MLVIGAGPSGLSAAYHLARLGHAVEIHDAGPVAGGMLQFGIPAYRLPRDIVARETGRLEEMGVRFVFDHKVENVLAEQRAGAFDAVYVAVGAQANRHVDIPVRDSARVLAALPLLRDVGGGERPRIGRRVVIYGGGNTAMDAARTAKRLGAEEAVIVYRRDRAHMTAHAFEADEAAAEGVKIKWLSGIKDISGSDITVERMELDANGRPQPTGEFETLKADTVILALGQTTDIAFLRQVPGIEFAADGTIIVGDDMQTGHPGIFAGGDVTPATRTVTNATGQGKRAARHIDRWLRDEAAPRSDRHRVIPFEELHLPMYNDTLAPREAEVPPDQRKGFDEVVMGLDARQAQHEAGRCLSCGNCYECDNCFAACPEDAIVKLGPGRGYEIKMTRCTGCAICFDRCPCHAIEMVPETARGVRAMSRRTTMDGNTAVATVAYKLNEVCAIYPITPSSTMAELADEWVAQGRPNLWGNVPVVQEMQSEGGAAGAVHGALQSGALTTTFTASQGLMLMLPNMYKIAGELTPTVFHVAARALATSALSIFGDHSDVMAARATGFALLGSATVQEAHDCALAAQVATLESRVPFLHFFDGFRTSHELNTLELLDDSVLQSMIDHSLVRAHRARALSPEHPFVRGTAHNSDTFFQAREAVNPYYMAVPGIVAKVFDRLGALTGRHYRLFEYEGAPDAERVLILMGSGAETARETVKALVAAGEKVGAIQIRLYRPFSAEHLLAVLPTSVRRIAVLEQTKEPGATGDPVYLDVVATLATAVSRGTRAALPLIVGGRYGLASKDFPPALVKAALDELKADSPRHGFTLGIDDDVTHLSLVPDPAFNLDKPSVKSAVFFGLGADGTVGANKNTVKIISEDAGLFAQGYFVYDSHKSGAQTISHLRFSPEPIHAPYLITRAGFVACHKFDFLERLDVLRIAAPGATFLLNAPYGPEEVWDRLPRLVQQQIIDKQLRFHVIDASRAARELGLGARVNTILQTCFFALSGVLPLDEAIAQIKHSIEETYGGKGARGRADEHGGGGRRAGAAARGRGPGPRHRHTRTDPAGADRGSGVHPRRDREDIRGAGRRDPGQQDARRWHVPFGHHRLREAKRRPTPWRNGARTSASSVVSAASSVRTA